MRSGEEIQSALRAFAQRWRGYAGSERSEAQTFLNELFACYGLDRKDVGARFEDPQLGGIVDLLWEGQCLFEMKAPRETPRLLGHADQGLGYWRKAGDDERDLPAPPYVVLCSFEAFHVWEPGRFPSATKPRIELRLEDLPDNYEALQFLIGREPYYQSADRALTTDATKQVVALLKQLQDRNAAPVEELQLFVLQFVWCLFAERLDLITGRPLEQTLHRLQQEQALPSGALLNHLFALLDQRDARGKDDIYEGVPYANGGLFQRPSRVNLKQVELDLAVEIAGYEWDKVNPTIFGSLMEGYFHRGTRSEVGAHYTHEIDILKIVEPTIVGPWQQRIDAATTVDEARQVLEELCRFKVLDPACGCGNFLYVAYRKLRDLEAAAKQRIRELARSTGVKEPTGLSFFPIGNMHGLEIQPFSVLLTRVTLWMGHKLAADEHGMAEPVLPLVDLPTVVQGDALKLDWPEVDAIIGNPPFNGSQWLRRSLGDDYVEWLKKEFACGIKDYCVYWFRKAHDHLPEGGRAGLVGTNSISQNRARSASLDYIVANGGVITNAVSTQDWPGAAAVDVSIVNWVKGAPPKGGVLDGYPVSAITSDLQSPGRSTGTAVVLSQNRSWCFQGPIPVGEGFVLDSEEAAHLLDRGDIRYADVVRPFLVGQDIAEDPTQRPRRWVIDFGLRSLEDAARYPAALRLVESRVRPIRETNRRAVYRRHWWRFGEPRPAMRKALDGLDRYMALGRIGKRLLFIWAEPHWCPSDLVFVIARDDDYALGVLSSVFHNAWAVSRPSTLEDRFRYTATSMFETFPWPDASDGQQERIGELARRIVERRQEICLAEQIGLTELYNRVDDGAYQDLKQLHRELDEAVAEAYGWPKKVAHDPDEIVRRLLERNLEIAAGKREYDPFRKKGADRPMLLPE